MRLMKVIEGLPISPSSADDPEVRGITHDSRRVVEGDLYVALIGQRFDGRIFLPEALERGAVAVLASGPAPPDYGGSWLATADPRVLLGPLSARIHGHPDRELTMVGVTGTNGKSTVALLMLEILEAAGSPAGSIGTLGYSFRGRQFDGLRTTPEASDLFGVLRRIRDAGAEAVAAEISSHALAMNRVEGVTFDLAVFTNLTRDHFDFHHSFEEYFAAKRRLFAKLKPTGSAVVNVDDPYGRRLALEIPKAVTFGRQGNVRLAETKMDLTGLRGSIETPRGAIDFESRLLGRYNLENILAAVAGAEALGLPHDAVVAGLAARGPLPGRMELVDRGQPFPVVVDYAHTDAALEAAIRSLRIATGGRILVVFGCGGDRDPGKRALMGRVAGELAEMSIITSDNPRLEDPLAIIAAVEEGMKQSGNPNYRILPDRSEAIRRAVAHAGPDWAVLVAGKGHEEVQIVGDRELPFSDREEVVQALEERFGAGPSA